MEKIKLRIPFSIPILGEAFADINNPVVFSTINFFTDVSVSFKNSSEIQVPISNLLIKKIITNYLKKKGIFLEININPVNDFFALTSLFYIIGIEEIENDITFFINKLKNSALIIFFRALTSLSGGFTICRKNEGIISIDGKINASLLINIKNKKKSSYRLIRKFENNFPELYNPLVHTIGHIAIEGGKAIRDGMTERLGNLMNIESMILCIFNLIKPKSLPIVKNSYGVKMIVAGDITGSIILVPRNFLYKNYQSFDFTDIGVREIE
ncbi:MAG: hypothetical protein LM593_01395 [Candidatus Verstraetearchaeota archaeon]|jgi:mevalonate kinase|nr:hypothetical protein [Candidatus Verstraetearchaeota archaeon]